MLGILERFPEEDGCGIFWGIVHVVEACPGYAAEVIESVRRKPCEFNVLLIVRMLAAGIAVADGISIEDALREVRENDSATSQVVEDAKSFLEGRKTLN